LWVGQFQFEILERIWANGLRNTAEELTRNARQKYHSEITTKQIESKTIRMTQWKARQNGGSNWIWATNED
jgi:hypothetical protein